MLSVASDPGKWELLGGHLELGLASRRESKLGTAMPQLHVKHGTVTYGSPPQGF